MLKSFDQKTTACFTGHRFIPASLTLQLRSRIETALLESYNNGYRTFLCGGARGFDTLAALEVLQFRNHHPDIRLVLAVPCADQADLWPESDRKIWESVRVQANEVCILSESYYNGCMQARNRFMVDASSLCFCYLNRFQGGTWFTVRYALHCGLMLKNLAMPDLPVPVMKEYTWNCMFISRSVSENVNTVRLSPFRLQKRKRMHMLHRSSGNLH